MRHYVFLTTLPYYKFFSSKLNNNVAYDSRITITSSNYKLRMNTFNTRPFFSDHYVLNVFMAEREDEYLQAVIKWASYEWVQIILNITYLDLFRIVCEKLHIQKVDFAAVNCYKIQKRYKILYIQQEMYLKCHKIPSADLCEFLISRAKGCESQMDIYIDRLSVIGFSKESIEECVKPVDYVTLSNLAMKLLLGDSRTACLKTLSKYRRSSKLLIDCFNEFFSNWEKLYTEYREGRFTTTNYMKWVAVSGKSFKVYSEYSATQWLKFFSMYSYGYVINLKHELNSIPAYDWFSVFTKLFILA